MTSEEENDEYLQIHKTIIILIYKLKSKFFLKEFDVDFKIVDGNGHRTNSLEKLYNALLTIRPTSTASDRAFSGSFMTKIRSQLNTNTLNEYI